MSDEINNVPENTETPATPVERPAIEQRAMELGWRPKEEFHGNEDDFIDAKEFVRRQPLFEKIEAQNRQIKNVTRALEAFKQHYTVVEQAAVERAIATLKAQRKEALSDGDGDRFELLDDEIKKAETKINELQEIKKQPVVEEEVVRPEWQAFQARNPWYNTTGYMRKFADEIGINLAQKGLAPEEVLKQVEQAVRKEFPHKFTNPNKESAPNVEQSRGNSKSKTSNDEAGLTDMERRIMNDLVRSGSLTKEKYLADLKAIKSTK